MSEETSNVASPLEKQERTITVQGIDTHLFEAGLTDAPTVLYLHGSFLGNLWLEFHILLAQKLHVIAVDIPGFGKTPRPDWMRDMSDYVLYLRDLVDTLRLEKPYVVGHSLGGWLAAELAVWYPDRVGKLVLSNAAGIRVKGKMIANLLAMNPQETLSACFDNFMAAMVLMPSNFDNDYLLDQYRQRATLATLAWNPSYDPKLERRLASVKVPTLVIWGQNDRIIDVAYADAFQRAIPGAEIVKLEGTGHMPMFEQPQEWSQAIADFLHRPL